MNTVMFPIGATFLAIFISVSVFVTVWAASYLLVAGSFKCVRNIKNNKKGDE